MLVDSPSPTSKSRSLRFVPAVAADDTDSAGDAAPALSIREAAVPWRPNARPAVETRRLGRMLDRERVPDRWFGAMDERELTLRSIVESPGVAVAQDAGTGGGGFAMNGGLLTG